MEWPTYGFVVLLFKQKQLKYIIWYNVSLSSIGTTGGIKNMFKMSWVIGGVSYSYRLFSLGLKNILTYSNWTRLPKGNMACQLLEMYSNGIKKYLLIGVYLYMTLS